MTHITLIIFCLYLIPFSASFVFPFSISRSQRDLISVSNRNNLMSNGYVTGSVRNSARSVGNLSRSNSRNNINYNPTHWFAAPAGDDIADTVIDNVAATPGAGIYINNMTTGTYSYHIIFVL